MAKLSEMSKLMNMYIELHGDKEISSIATHNGSSKLEYTLHLYDIYDGPIGTNPYTGKDRLNIPRRAESMQESAISAIKKMADIAGQRKTEFADKGTEYPCEYNKADLQEKECETLQAVLAILKELV